MTHAPGPGHAQSVVIPHAVLLLPEVQPSHQDTFTVNVTLRLQLALTYIPVSRVTQVIPRVQTVAVFTEALQKLLSASLVAVKVLIFQNLLSCLTRVHYCATLEKIHVRKK